MRQAFRSFRLQMSILIALSVLLIPIGTLATNHSPDPDQIWAGTVETAGFWGAMQLKLSRQGDQWKGESNFDLAGTRVPGPVRDLKIDSDKIVFSTDVQVMDVRFTFHFDGKSYGSKLRGVVSKGKLIWTKSYGYADAERRIPATRETVYRIGWTVARIASSST